jgi:hypothetical protein
MALLLLLQDNLAVQRLAIQRARVSLPHALTAYRLQGTSPEPLLRECRLAQDRLAWFEPHQPTLATIDNWLGDSVFFFASEFELRQQWHQTLDCIGDLTYPQASLALLSRRLTQVANNQRLIARAWLSVSEQLRQAEESPSLYTFGDAWRTLWLAMPDLTTPALDVPILNALHTLATLTQQSFEVVY